MKAENIVEKFFLCKGIDEIQYIQFVLLVFGNQKTTFVTNGPCNLTPLLSGKRGY